MKSMLDALKKIQADIGSLRKDIDAEQRERIAKKSLRQRSEELGQRWFSHISPSFDNSWGVQPDTFQRYNQGFARLIKLSAPNNHKKSYLDVLSQLRRKFRDELIIPLQTRSTSPLKSSLLEDLLSELPNPDENAYMKEAVKCAKHQLYRAAAVLGWCVAIDRIHHAIEKIGFANFNATSSLMASQTKGRFKKFNKQQNVNSLSELREVFDTVVLWILEGMKIMDINQHTRLRSCFDLRCQCAHPGDAPITEYNLLSFYSDINEIILKNPKFGI